MTADVRSPKSSSESPVFVPSATNPHLQPILGFKPLEGEKPSSPRTIPDAGEAFAYLRSSKACQKIFSDVLVSQLSGMEAVADPKILIKIGKLTIEYIKQLSPDYWQEIDSTDHTLSQKNDNEILLIMTPENVKNFVEANETAIATYKQQQSSPYTKPKNRCFSLDIRSYFSQFNRSRIMCVAVTVSTLAILISATKYLYNHCYELSLSLSEPTPPSLMESFWNYLHPPVKVIVEKLPSYCSYFNWFLK